MPEMIRYTLNGVVREDISKEAEAILKEDITALEGALCAKTGASHCLAVPGVPLGLYIALRAAGVMMDEPVLCSGFAQEHLVQSVLLAGGKPLLVDINPNTYNIDPYLLEYIIGKCIRTKRPIPRVLVIADLFGLPCNYNAIEEICYAHEITLIVDAGESLGGSAQGIRAGTAGRFGVISLAKEPHNPQKGECGAVLCHSAEDRELLQKMLRQSRGGAYLDAVSGDSIRAGIALERLEEHWEEIRARQKSAGEYRDCFAGGLKIQQIPEEYESSSSRFVVSLPSDADKAQVLARLAEKGIPCECFEVPGWEWEEDEWSPALLMNARNAYERLIVIPMNPFLGGRVTADIARSVIRLVRPSLFTNP